MASSLPRPVTVEPMPKLGIFEIQFTEPPHVMMHGSAIAVGVPRNDLEYLRDRINEVLELDWQPTGRTPDADLIVSMLEAAPVGQLQQAFRRLGMRLDIGLTEEGKEEG